MKLFLSSTYQDLREHRKRVIEVIDRLRHNGVDVEWFGMEAFGARDDLPADACIEFVDACDLYLGFFGVRYGSIDPKSGKSMTEVEYRRAVEKNKSRLIFLIDEQNARVTPSDFETSPEGQAKLRALKDDLKKDRVVDFFTSPEDLASKVATALAAHLPISNLQSLIPLPPIPYIAHPYAIEAHFTGRARERALLSEWLTRGERQTATILVIEAIGGMGKSALAWFWLHNDLLPLNTEHWSLTGIFWWSFYTERDFGVFLARALTYVSGGKVDPKTIASNRERVDVLANLMRQSRFLFVLDGFERVLRAYAQMDAAYRGDAVDMDARAEYRACADPNIGIFLQCLASGGTLSKVLITLRLLPRELDDLAGVMHLPLTGMDPDDAVEFFRKQNIKGTRAEIQAVCAEYGFHPLSLRLLAGTLAKDPRYRADIRYAPRVNPLEADKERKILDVAYNSLPPDEQKLLSQLAAFRSPLTWDALKAIFASPVIASEAKQSPLRWLGIASARKPRLAMTEQDLARALTDLQERGLCMRDVTTNTFDLHPVIRRYAYDRLADKAQTHATLAEYFSKEVDKGLSDLEKQLPIELRRFFGIEKKVQSLADLQPTIELYHHTVRAGRYDEACELFRDRIPKAAYYQLGAYQLCIELLRALFPDGEDKPPPLKTDRAKSWVLTALANSFSLSGQPRFAVRAFQESIAIDEKANNKKNLAIGLGNVADDQLKLGELKAAEENLRRRIEICREIKDEFNEAVGHQELGRVLVYRGLFAEAERELAISTAYWQKTNDAQGQSIDYAYRALRALLMGDASAALSAARQAREFAEETARTLYPHERDFIRAEWLMGAAWVALVVAAARAWGMLGMLGTV